MINIKLGELRSIIEGFNAIMDEKLPIKIAYSFGKLTKKIQKEFVLFEENRRRIIETHGKRDKDGKLMSENGKYLFDDIEAFNKEFSELAEIEIEIDFIPLALEQLNDINITPASLAALERFISE